MSLHTPELPTVRRLHGLFLPLLLVVCCIAVPSSRVAGQTTVSDETASDRTRASGADENPTAEKMDETDDEGEPDFLTNIRQLTFEGKRSGEGYFSADGQQMVFQSERDPTNPFYQIYLMDRTTGDVTRVSPGFGKTTCAWIHPTDEVVLFSSTQYDAAARDKMQAELDFRASGQEKRYSWDYDPEYELVEWDATTNSYSKITNAKGYDAEGSYSPDGDWIAFASNRRAYEADFPERERALFEIDPASAMDIYIMRRDGSELKRLTDIVGYDGGPFFSPDGSKICWRRFDENGVTAEIYTMNVDGTEPVALTQLNRMSWAPFFHPSGDYLIFTTNIQGFENFELYAIAAEGNSTPVRVTYTDGFDGLPVFTPDGKSLVWTTTRASNNQSQLFTADWNDAAIRTALALNEDSGEEDIDVSGDAEAGTIAAAATISSFTPLDIARHVDYLCRTELGGRLTGSEGEKKATAYVASVLESFGLEPGGKSESWYAEFPFTAGVDVGPSNDLHTESGPLTLNTEWRPIVFSENGEIAPTEIVVAGYGIVAPETDEFDEYDSYTHLDVEDKWVLVFRQMPMDITPELRQHFARHSSLRYKATMARDRGAKGLIVVSGPTSGVRNELVPLQLDGALSGSSIAAISISDEVARQWFEQNDLKLAEVQASLDSGEMAMGFTLDGVSLAATIDVNQVRKTGRNVLGWLRAGDQPTKDCIIIGAHIDHLGVGQSGSSLATEDEKGGMHRGADDNASGVASVLEIAQYLANQKQSGKLKLQRDILFAAWSGEELGLIGSSYFADEFYDLYPGLKTESGTATNDPENPHAANPHAEGTTESSPSAGQLYPAVAACLNLDMVGRLRDNLVLQGIGSSPIWTQEIERRNAVVGLPIVLQNDSYLPTDASTFYLKGVPILSAFTGSHSEYHTPRDTPDLLNYEGASDTAKLLGLIARSLASSQTVPEFLQQTAPENQGTRARMTAYLGTIPDYAQADIKGVLLSGVSADSPSSKAGLQGGDVIVELAGKTIENIYDYTFAIEALKVNEETEIVIKRDQTTKRLKITPASRQ